MPRSTGTAPQNATAGSQSKQETSADQVKAEEKQRILGVLPEFNTINGDEAVPLTPGEKFHLWYKSSFDPVVFITTALVAGYGQADDDYPGYRQGAEGYGKRYGASYTDTVDGNLWGNAILPSLLKQDPRYYRLGHGTLKRRLWYAAISTVRTKGDNGKWQPNYSNVGGNIIGGGISNIYYPAEDRGLGLTFENAGTVTAEGALGSIAYEFYPDVVAHFKHRHDKATGVAPSQPEPESSAPSGVKP